MVSLFGDPREKRPWIPAYCIAFQTTATILVGLRLITRFRRTGGDFGLDDAFIVAGWIFGSAMTIIFIEGALHYGYDGHTSALVNIDVTKTALIGFLGELFYLLSTNSTKLAVLLFYRRLVQSTISKNLQWAIWIAMAVTVAYLITFIAVLITVCNPVEARWMRFSQAWLMEHNFHFKCRSDTIPVTFSGAFSAFGDAYALAIPAIVLSKLQMRRREKLGLYAVFALGVSVVTAGAVRTWYAYQVTIKADAVWYGANTFLAAVAELQLALICACAPSLRAMFRKFFLGTLALGSGFTGRRNHGSTRETTSSSTTLRSKSNQGSNVHRRDISWPIPHPNDHHWEEPLSTLPSTSTRQSSNHKQWYAELEGQSSLSNREDR